MNPTEWVDRKRQNAVNVIPNGPAKLAIKGEASAEQILSRLASLDSARQLLRDDFDPLDLKDSNFIRQVQLSQATLPNSTELSNSNLEELSTSALDSTTMITPSNSIIITKASFDSRTFLCKVHGETSFKDLIRGKKNLEIASKQRNESLKNLVKQNFDRFVNAKNATELVFRDMQQRRLIDQDHGMRRAIEALTTAYQRAQEVYGSLMARREREQLIRKRIELFNRYSFIFSLGYRLEQSMRIGEYQMAVIDYRKAKTMMMDASSHTLQTILQKIWSGHVEKTLIALRADLTAKLSNPIFSYQVHSKLIDFLIDLDSHPDPVVSFFTIRKDELFDQYNKALNRCLSELNQVTPDVDTAAVPRIILGLVQKRQSHRVGILHVDIVRCWKIRASLVYSMVELFKKFYDDYGKFLNALSTGRFCRNQSKRSIEIGAHEKRIQTFSDEFYNNFERIIKQILDPKILIKNNIQESSIAASHYSLKSTPQLCDMLLATWDTKAPPSVAKAVQLSVEGAIGSLLNSIWNIADEDCALLPQFETWQSSGEGFDFSTVLIKGFETLVITLIDASSMIIMSLIESANQFKRKLYGRPTEGLDDRLADAICSFLKALENLVIDSERKTSPDAIITIVDSQKENVSLEDLGVSYKLLTVMTNVLYLRQVAVPHIIDAFSASVMGEIKELAKERIVTAIDDIDQKVRQHFLKGKRSRIIALIRTGTINSGFDWMGKRSPSEIRPYILTILLELVGVQTQVYDVSSAILRPLMSELVLDILQEFLRCIQLIRNFGPGGYLQARAEVTLLQQKLITVMDREALEVYSTINSTLDSACVAELETFASIEEVRKTVDQLVRKVDQVTSMSFSCFQYT